MNDIRIISHCELRFLSKFYRCVIGSKGFTENKKEGDQKTPTGRFQLRECWYRADRISAPVTSLPLRMITDRDGWCDDTTRIEYNKHVTLPFPGAHETLWRDDNLYDIIVTISYNDSPVVPGKGSAIFFHLSRPDYQPTLGCVAVILPDMLEILKECSNESRIVIQPEMKIAKLYETE
jgi:L,D-peptidoglycan transpeptidase YkuD (ErfK/YbiS/YcfS/YnhG family)